MKNLLVFVLMFAASVATAAPTASGDAVRANKNAPQYLGAAADAWASVIGGGTSGEIATYIRDNTSDNIIRMLDTVAVLAYNDSALTLYQGTAHLNNAFSVVNTTPHRRTSSKQVLMIDGDLFGNLDEYDNNQNANFKTRTVGGAVRARGFITDGFAFGVQYATGHTETRHSVFSIDGTSNSITIFSQYISGGGLFMNFGINGGTTRWESDKTAAGVSDTGAYNTDFWAGAMSMGAVMRRGGFSLTPQIGVTYAHFDTDRHVDAAAQTFEKWWYNTLTGYAGLSAGYDFITQHMRVIPSITFGASYDAISNGTDKVRVKVLGGETYDIPVDAPHRSAMNAGLGVQMVGKNISGGIGYKLDARNDYISHTARADIKFIF